MFTYCDGWIPAVRKTPALQSVQRGGQIRNGPFTHPWYAVQSVFALSQCHHRRQKAHRRSGVANEQICLMDGNDLMTVWVVDPYRPPRPIIIFRLHSKTKAPQSVHHDLGDLAPKSST